MATDGRQRRRVLLGGLLIAALVTAALLVFFLDNVIARFARRYEIVAIVPEAPGLTNGSAVWVGGKEVGTVQQVALLPVGADTAARVALRLQLPQSVRAQVRADSRVRFAAARLIGERAVDITPGTPQAPVLADGDTLRLDDRLTPAALTARAAVVKTSLDSVLGELRALAPVAEARLEQTRRAFAALEPAMREAATLREGLTQGAASDALRDPAFAASLQRARAAAAELPATLGLLRMRAGEVQELAAGFARLQLRADSIRAQLTAAADLMGAQNGSLTRFQQDSALIKAIRAAQADLDSLIAEARRNPLRFLR